MSALLNLQIPKLYSLFSTSPFPHKLSQPQFQSLPLTFTRNISICLSPPHSLHNESHHSGLVQDEEEPIIGDCVVLEEGIFDDPHLHRQPVNPGSRREITRQKKNSTEVEPENLVPENWTQVQREINITKKEKRRLAREMEFGRRVERKRLGLRPIGEDGRANVGVEDYSKLVEEKLKQLKPIVFDNPVFPEAKREGNREKSDEDLSGGEEECSVSSTSNSRAAPKNPRRAVYGGDLDDIREFFNSRNYDPSGAKKSEGRPKLFSKEEKLLMNKKVPDLAVATSRKWQPFHTFAASGEFYYARSLLKHIVDVNVPDKDGLTAIHKAILSRKHAIFNFLLRESANPFIRDKDGATLMHYAVRTASSSMIKILLLYNVDINLQDEYGWAPLHVAIQSQRTDIVRLLLIKGADKTLRNWDGLTPIDLCLHSGRDIRTYELLKLLKQLPNNSKISAS